MKKIILFVLSLFLFWTYAQPQETRSHNHSLNFNYLQLKEEMNYGLVFHGSGLSYAFSCQWQNNRRVLNYEAMIGFTYMQTRKVPAGNININPVKLSYLFKGTPGNNLVAGSFFMADYNYQFYPDLHSGHSFWFTHISFGGMLQYHHKIGKQLFEFSLNTSMFGITSRQPEYHDPYFWDLSAGDIVKYFHQDLHFGSWNEYNCSELEVRWVPAGDSRFMFAYEINYMGYYREPKLSVLYQSLKLIIQPKSK